MRFNDLTQRCLKRQGFKRFLSHVVGRIVSTISISDSRESLDYGIRLDYI